MNVRHGCCEQRKAADGSAAAPPTIAGFVASESPAPRRRVARNTAIFAVFTAFSRVAGLIREIVAAYYFGASGRINSFTVAFQIPNLVRALVADSALSGAFVPVFVPALVPALVPVPVPVPVPVTAPVSATRDETVAGPANAEPEVSPGTARLQCGCPSRAAEGSSPVTPQQPTERHGASAGSDGGLRARTDQAQALRSVRRTER